MGQARVAVLLGCRYGRSCCLSGRHRPGHCVAVLVFQRKRERLLGMFPPGGPVPSAAALVKAATAWRVFGSSGI